MTRRSFITSALQSLALVGALKLGLGNMTAEDVRSKSRWTTTLKAEWYNSIGECGVYHFGGRDASDISWLRDKYQLPPQTQFTTIYSRDYAKH